MAEEKATMRKSMLKKMADLDQERRKEIGDQLAENLFETDLWKKAERIGIYLSFGSSHADG